MEHSKWKRVFALAIAVLLIAAFGCGKAALDQKATAEASPEVVALDSAVPAESSGAEHSGVYLVDGTKVDFASGLFTSSAENENAVRVQNAGQLKIGSAEVNKTGGAQGDFSVGSNAAIAVLSQGALTLLDSTVKTGALGAFGCYVSGAGSVLTIAGTYLEMTGDSSPALVVNDGGSVTITGGILSTEGMDSACLMLSGGSASLSSVTLKSTSGEFLRVLSGKNTLMLDAVTISDRPILGVDSTLALTLQNGASFTGELGGELPAKVSLSLDAASSLTITADTYLIALVNADTTHQNIQSNGFYLYYDSNAPENAYLNNQSFALPGGGYLAPII